MFGLCSRFRSWFALRRLVLACTTCCSVVLFRFVRRCAIRSCLVFRGFVLGSFVLSGLVLARLTRSCPVLGRFCRGCLVRFGLICSCFVLNRSVLSSFIFSGLVLGRLGFGGFGRRRSPARRHYVLVGKFSRLGRCRNSRTPVIHRRQHFMIPACRLLVACLRRGRRSVRRA